MIDPLRFMLVTLGFCVIWGLGIGLATCLFWAASWHSKAQTMHYADLRARCHRWVVGNVIVGTIGLVMFVGGVYGYIWAITTP